MHDVVIQDIYRSEAAHTYVHVCNETARAFAHTQRLIFLLDKSVAAIFATIQHAAYIGVAIGIDEKVVAQ